ncbi:MAG: kynureninase [Halobacteriovoraceae bacterium]|jgi:kynureninase|nr:kynureninase [Halobacteriovoraceae bacterium]
MTVFNSSQNNSSAADDLDAADPLKDFRAQFEIPKTKEGSDCLYFCGHSLGLMPKQTRQVIAAECDAWGALGVEGHFDAKHPWLPYHEFLTEGLTRIVGAQSEEVVAMNGLTTNLHLMLVSFYRPTKNKFKILIENNTFPSDKYAVDSQARFHGYDPNEAIIELRPRDGELRVREEDLEEQIAKHGDQLALIMLGNCNYLSGQCFDFKKITELGHSHDAMVGFNLAHGAGNLELSLHDWNVDFAVWCSYKYLNSGPGGIAGAFVHKNHLGRADLPRFEGWWGTNKETRFKMQSQIDPIPTVEAWQLSNPPIFQLAALRSSLEIFDQAKMSRIVAKRNKLSSYLEFLLSENVGQFVEIMTPAFVEGAQKRGAMLSVRMKQDPKKLISVFAERGVILDFREPDILRMAPAPLYNSYRDVFDLVQIIKEVSHA